MEKSEMDPHKIEIVEKAISKSKIPASFFYSTITYDGKEALVKDYVRDVFSGRLKDNVTVDQVAFYLENTFFKEITTSKKITTDEKTKAIANFLNNIPDSDKKIRISEHDYLDIEEYFYENVRPYVIDQNHAIFGGKVKSFEDIYQRIKDNEYHEPTIEDFKEICDSFLEYIDDSLLDSDYEDTTLRCYITYIMPRLMISVSIIVVDDQAYLVEDYLENLIKEQQKKIDEDVNRAREKPILVSEIQDQLDNGLNEQGNINTAALLEHVESVENIELSIRHSLDVISDAIDASTKEADLNNLLLRLNEFIDVNDIYLRVSISKLKERIEQKRKSIIKINNNKEDLIVAANGRIDLLEKKINEATKSEDGTTITGLITMLEDRLKELNIDDSELLQKIKDLKDYNNCKIQSIRGSIGEYKNVNEANVKIDEQFDLIKKTMEYLDDTESVFFDSTVRSLNYILEDLYGTIKAAANSNSISKQDQEKYEHRLREIVKELEEKNKMGSKVR